MAPPYKEPVTWVPENWKYAESTQETSQEFNNWWEVFDDENLNALEAQALSNNKDVYAAFERIVQARALACIARSETFPQLNLEPAYTNEGILYMLYDPVRVLREHRRTNRLPFVLNYELDLWGKLKNAYKSAYLSAEAEKEAFRTSILILTTDLALNYFQIRTYDANISLLEKTTNANKKQYELLKLRYEGKIIDYADVSRAELEYKNTEAQYFQAQKLRSLEENKMAVLLGIPASEFNIEPKPLQDAPPEIPPGVPSDILLQRPDIAQIERIRASNNAKIGVARASFFPSISLTGILGYSSPELTDFLRPRSHLWGIGADALMPIYDAGRLGCNLEYAMSQFREADAEYQQQVLKAFQEVEDALANLDGLKNEYESIFQSVRAAKNSYNIAADRYFKGVTFYLDVVDTERQALDAERNMIELLGQQYTATVQLIKALGGSWQTHTENQLTCSDI